MCMSGNLCLHTNSINKFFIHHFKHRVHLYSELVFNHFIIEQNKGRKRQLGTALENISIHSVP